MMTQGQGRPGYGTSGIARVDGYGGGAVARAGVGALGLYAPLWQRGDVRVRLHRDYPYNDMCLVDDVLLVLHRVYGVLAGQCPVLQLHRLGDSAVLATYLAAFERLWAGARPA